MVGVLTNAQEDKRKVYQVARTRRLLMSVGDLLAGGCCRAGRGRNTPRGWHGRRQKDRTFYQGKVAVRVFRETVLPELSARRRSLSPRQHS